MNPVRANMVTGPRQYKWSSYRDRVGLIKSGMLDFDLTYLGLADNKTQRIERYKHYIQQGASDKEMALLRNAWTRNQLTGNGCFAEEIEKRLGYRVENRGRGNPGV